MPEKIVIYDTTLRDGTQGEDVHFSCEDKIRVAKKLDELGVDYLEAGWPASNPTDEQFFREMQHYQLDRVRIAAFGSTHNPRTSPENDSGLATLRQCGANALTIFGKTWEVHVHQALKTDLEHNLRMIRDSLAFLREHTPTLFFDAEHFFDGFKENRDYALACLKKAHEAGADTLILCDTNGGTLTSELGEIASSVAREIPGAQLGIHAHNDSDLAVANSLAAVESGMRHVQGTINGFGERCGNANLCSIIPCLQLKMGYTCLPEGRLQQLASTSHFVSEVANLRPFSRQPFVGNAAFAHKGGVHVSAVLKDARTYEHIEPEKVGNKQRVLLSDLSGKSNILFKARQYGIHLEKDDPFVLDILNQIKELESKGYDFSVAEASFELLLHRAMGRTRRNYTLLGFRAMDAKNKENEEPFSEATVMIQVGGDTEHTAATGRGPVNALDNALRKGLEKFYSNIKEMDLLDFKVRVLSPSREAPEGTASRVRVFIESGDTRERWITVGVSYNIIEASWQALVDSVDYKLFKDGRDRQSATTSQPIHATD
ncbi:MAG: citramalate synthase [Desulfohalobiaceae bacterium]|nr:citramalate synthase [Desulfohalobiaceae bacterium]